MRLNDSMSISPSLMKTEEKGTKKVLTIGLVGNPNCGKTTLFNGLTGSHQHIGNWPGVTVEKKEGQFFLPDGTEVKLVDLPGIYSLTAASEDEAASLRYILSHEADLYINVVDSTTLERNLYLTLLLCELQVPMVMAVTMMDIAKQRRITVDIDHLAHHLGVPVVGIDATRPQDITALSEVLVRASQERRIPKNPVVFPNELEDALADLGPKCANTASFYDVEQRWVARKALEGDPLITASLEQRDPEALAEIPRITEASQRILKDPPDVIFAETRYGIIGGLVRDVVHIGRQRMYLSEKIDAIVLNRYLGIPVFLGLMYIVFWFTQVVGGAFIDFFEIAGDAIFVQGTARLLGAVSAPAWLVGLLSNGVGAALQTVGTFLPPVGFMFLALSILEDSGYMARAAFVMDRLMRWIGLPGKSFVPLLVGFGCTVPAIMATRTLESKRDRFLTLFMTPFMSCGAKLPIWVLFAAAFFPANPGKFVFVLYMTGVLLGIGTGLLLKVTLFQGEPTHFIMELPPYHLPRAKHILLHTWERLRIFIVRAGTFIVPMVLVLGFLNTIGTDGRIGDEGREDSLLSVAGKAITPVFGPIGVEKENWPASVAVFTGLFAKESVIGTLKGLYGQMDSKGEIVGLEGPAQAEAEKGAVASLGEGLAEAVLSIPKNLAGIGAGLVDPLGLREATAESENASARAEKDAAVASLRRHFPKGVHQMFSYLLFILLYVPCLAATGLVFREVGRFYGVLFVVYLTALGWSVAAVYHALMVAQSLLWLGVGVGIPVAMFLSFLWIGRKRRVEFV